MVVSKNVGKAIMAIIKNEFKKVTSTLFQYLADYFVRSRNLKFDILTSFFVLQIVTSIAIVSYTYNNNSRALVELSDNLMEDVSTAEVASISSNFREVLAGTELISYLVSDISKVNLQNKDLINYMIGYVRQFTLTDSVYIGTESGYFLEIKVIAPGETYRSGATKPLPKKVAFALRVVDRTTPKVAEIWYYLDESGNKVDEESLPEAQVTYVHKNRPWYQKAAQTREKIWTDIFVSDASGAASMASGVPLFSGSGELVGVISATVNLANFASLLARNSIKGLSMVVNQKGEIIAHPTEKNFAKSVNGQVKLITVEDLKNKTAAKALQTRTQRGQPQRLLFDYDGEEYVSLFKGFNKTAGKDNLGEQFNGWEFMMIVKTNEFLGKVKKTQSETMTICLIILIASIMLIAFIASRIAKPINSLSQQADKITNFELGSVEEVRSGIKELQKLQNSISRMRKSLLSFSKFVPKSLVRKLIDKGIEVKIGGSKKQLSIFFSDIANFTTISETYPAERLVEHLSEYFDEMTGILIKHHGTIDKYIGDAIMAFWGAPQHDANHSLNCCVSALLCQRRLLDLNRKWIYEKKPQLITRIGIHSGEVVVGNIGSSERMNYTILGDSVNLAARLEGTNKVYGTNIIVSASTIKHLGDHAVARPLDIVAVKGKNEGIQIYELVALKNSDPLVLPTDEQVKFCNDFNKAFRFYLEQRWDEAIDIFHSLEVAFGADAPCAMYIARCEEFKVTPPPANWDGVYHLKSK